VVIGVAVGGAAKGVADEGVESIEGCNHGRRGWRSRGFCKRRLG
jgi:hypothetical protein